MNRQCAECGVEVKNIRAHQSSKKHLRNANFHENYYFNCGEIRENSFLMEWITGDNPSLRKKDFEEKYIETIEGVEKLNKGGWSGEFGERLVYTQLFNYDPNSGIKNCTSRGTHKLADLEDSRCIYEIKTKNYSIPGTACDKVFAEIFGNYLNIHREENKNMVIVLVGAIELYFKKKLINNDYLQKLLLQIERDVKVFVVYFSDMMTNMDDVIHRITQ